MSDSANLGNGASHPFGSRAVTRPAVAAPTPAPHTEPPTASADIIYGARAIAAYLFGEVTDRARRRVFNLWTFHQARKERAGFFKLKGGLCLSKSQWRKFHGLD